jgi:hypothetical protein
MNSEKLLKQNDAIYNSLVSRGITFDRVVIKDDDGEEEKITLLTNENAQLKELVKANKPPPQPKKEKQPQIVQQKKIKETNKDDETDDVDEYVEKVKSYSIIVNMENIKRFFFMNEIENFKEEIKMHNLEYYEANYRYNSDKDGAPEFSANNLLKGFGKKLENVRKYFMISFRCFKIGSNYKYKSLWIVNTTDNIRDVIGDFYDDFDFVKIPNNEINNFLINIEKKMITDESPLIDGELLINEVYIH